MSVGHFSHLLDNILIPSPIISLILAPPFPEKHYQQQWCDKHHGVMEYWTPGGRVDCLTETHAVEVDFARKWAEAIGQSLYYSHYTGKKPGILLVIGTERDQIRIKHIKPVVEKHGIDVWTVFK